MVYKIPHRKQKIEQHRPHLQSGELILSRLVLELLTLQGTTGYSTQHEPVL
jgi:hypothetical protein